MVQGTEESKHVKYRLTSSGRCKEIDRYLARYFQNKPVFKLDNSKLHIIKKYFHLFPEYIIFHHEIFFLDCRMN